MRGEGVVGDGPQDEAAEHLARTSLRLSKMEMDERYLEHSHKTSPCRHNWGFRFLCHLFRRVCSEMWGFRLGKSKYLRHACYALHVGLQCLGRWGKLDLSKDTHESELVDSLKEIFIVCSARKLAFARAFLTRTTEGHLVPSLHFTLIPENRALFSCPCPLHYPIPLTVPPSDHKIRPLSFEIITRVAIGTIYSRSVESFLR